MLIRLSMSRRKRKFIVLLLIILDALLVIKLASGTGEELTYGSLQLDLLPNIRFGLNLIPQSSDNIFGLFGWQQVTKEPQNEEGLKIEVWDEQDGVSVMELEEYIIHVVAGEMPASYAAEALKAQAVAARTFAMKHINGEAKCKSGHTICTDPSCCQACLSTDEMRASWGDSYNTYYQKLYDAVEATRGEVLTSDGKLISALYHSSSGGKTENSEAVFAVALPYLVSVDSEGEEDSPEYSDEKTFKNTELCELVNKAFPQANLSKPSDQIDIWGRTDSGRVKLVQLGGTVVNGQQFRTLLKLHSTNFSFKFSKDSVTITCIGFGHGVGMSQCGANAMAKRGSDYHEILEHYYTGVKITVMDSTD